MELHEIRYFLAACQTLNFSRAAAQCNVSQPALSRAIQKMEGELGGPLFVREGANTHLTELGRMLRPELEEAVAHTRAAKETARRFLRLEQAELSLGVLSTVGPRHFMAFLNRFRMARPGVGLSLTEGTAASLAGLLLAGELAVAIMTCPDTMDSRLRAEPLYEEPFVVAAAEEHRFARMESVPMRELAGETLLQRDRCEQADALRGHLAATGALPAPGSRTGPGDWVQAMAAAGMGVCVLPEYATTQSGLALRRLVEPGLNRTVSMVTVAGRRWSGAVANLLSAARAHPWPKASAAPRH